MGSPPLVPAQARSFSPYYIGPSSSRAQPAQEKLLQHCGDIEAGMARHRHHDRSAADVEDSPEHAEQPHGNRGVEALLKVEQPEGHAEHGQTDPLAAQTLIETMQDE